MSLLVEASVIFFFEGISEVKRRLFPLQQMLYYHFVFMDTCFLWVLEFKFCTSAHTVVGNGGKLVDSNVHLEFLPIICG